MLQFHTPPRRQGVILLLVVIMLALFLVVGLSFMLYAESAATGSRIYREAFTVNYDRADIDPNELLRYALGQLIYDVKDDIDGCDSSMRGHSLARNMYGWLDPNTTATPLLNTNTTAFTGIGRLPAPIETSPFPSVTDPRQLINYRFFQADGFVRDPERVGTLRPNPLTPITQAAQPFAGGWNVPYTFPDRNNVFLAAIKSNDAGGTPKVLMQSFHRPEGTPFAVANPNPIMLTNQAPWLDTTNPAFKYMVMRPRPVDMYWGGQNDPHSFPLPASDTGDVQNLPGGNGNDSFWIDLGYPVMTTRGGTKFKPLFAFLIVDLDGRVNVNVHGNIRGTNPSGQRVHVSNQGLGPWEVNLNKVLTAPAPPPPNPSEVERIFGFSTPPPAVVGRYGDNQTPGTIIPQQAYPDFPATTRRPFGMRLDFDGVDGASNNLTTRFNFPPTAHHTAPSYTAGYDGLLDPVNIRQQNPMNYNVLSANGLFNSRPNNDDVPISTAENLYYIIGDALGQNVQRAGLYAKGVRQNLIDARIRHMLTTLSFDMETPGFRPWVTNPQDPAMMYTLPTPTNPADPTQYHAKGPTTGFAPQVPSLVNTAAAPVPGSDFIADDGRCAVGPRLDLNRKLAPYPFNPADYLTPGPPPAANTPPDPVTQPYYRALWERQKFAREIFERLVQVTGAIPRITGFTPTAEQTNARRYLAQLAVNIVDYVDDDEFSTQFHWDDYDATGASVVYGVEAPKLVLNEVYAEIRNDKADDSQPFASQPFKVHFWIELFNPRMKALNPDGSPMMDQVVTTDNRADVQLTNTFLPGSVPIYRIQVLEEPAGFTPADMRALSNVDGRPTTGLTQRHIAQNWDQTASGNPQPPNERLRVRAIDPMDPNFPNGTPGTPGTSPGSNTNGYFVVASEVDIESQTPVQEPTNRLPTDNPSPGYGLSRTVPVATTVPAQPRHTFLLQRLACPHLQHNPPAPDPSNNPNLPANPYVTVDYVSNVRTYDAVRVVQFPATRMAGDGDPPATRRTKARAQPLAAAFDAAGGQQYTFFNPNSPNSNYDWMIHPDRPPISLMEMLHVSAFKPHEITQTFTDPTGVNKFQHVAPWTQLGNRLFRGLEYLTVGDRGNWTTFGATVAQTQQPSIGGRRPGKINLNGFYDREILNALTDAQQTNFFNEPTDVNNSWTAIRGRRTPILDGTATAGMPDKPFMSFGNPAQDPNPAGFLVPPGLDGTLMANGVFPGPANPPDLAPYIKNEMLTKIFNSATTRSNVFAVYLTVGFFEVLDDTVRPVRLGAEVRTRSGSVVRHRMFSIVDRTHLAIDDRAGTPEPFAQAASVSPAPTAPAPAPPGFFQQGMPLTRQFFLTSETAITDTEVAAGGQVTFRVVGGVPPNPSITPMTYDGVDSTLFTPGLPLGTIRLYADVGVNQEEVVCQINGDGSLTATSTKPFTKPHPAGFTLSMYRPGNPGPQGKIIYNDPRFAGVIPYKTIIQ